MHVLINFIDFIFQMKISVQMQLTQTHSRVMQFAGVSLTENNVNLCVFFTLIRIINKTTQAFEVCLAVRVYSWIQISHAVAFQLA